MKSLCDLYALNLMQKNLGALLVDGYMNSKQVSLLKVEQSLSAASCSAAARSNAFSIHSLAGGCGGPVRGSALASGAAGRRIQHPRSGSSLFVWPAPSI